MTSFLMNSDRSTRTDIVSFDGKANTPKRRSVPDRTSRVRAQLIILYSRLSMPEHVKNLMNIYGSAN